MKTLFASLLTVSCFLVLSEARADILPPPPPPPPPATVPLIHTPAPEAWQIVATGTALSLAIASLGVWMTRRKPIESRGRLWPVVIPLAIGSILTFLAAGWRVSVQTDQQMQDERDKAAYAERLKHWRPLGPVQHGKRPTEPATAPASDKPIERPGESGG